MEAKERLIFPLDFPNREEALKHVRLVSGHVGLFKVGLELFVSEGPTVLKAISQEFGGKVFLDLKLHDIPETVSRTLRAARLDTVQFLTVHCAGGKEVLRKAAESVGDAVRILGVTVLTSLSKEDLVTLGVSKELAEKPTDLVLSRAQLAKEAGLSGVVYSGLEVGAVRQGVGQDFVLVTPGIRPKWSVVAGDDQKRIVTPYDAVRGGADYVVVGRPIRTAPNPADACVKIAEEIESGMRDRTG
jgi:orotidine-5'-phosphate decarboxylase